MIKNYNLDLIILTETRLSGGQETAIISTLGFERYIKVEAMGFSGGIWVLWNPLNILVEPLATYFHEVYFKVQVSSSIFLLTALYASPDFYIRKTIWELSYLSNFITTPWLVMGDFNDISHPNEKFGGNPLTERKMKIFNDFLNKIGLIDLGFIGINTPRQIVGNQVA